MAFFFNNSCKFSGCGLSFTSLAQLIEHIEETHIDSDPQFIEKQELQQPSAVAASYVIRFVTDAARHQHQDIVPKKRQKPHPITGLTVSRSITPTGSEFDEEEIAASESDSDNSWTTQEEYSSDLILRTMGTHMGDDKPFVCPVPGCKKRYKNVNGIKYHAKNGHRKENKVDIKKNFKCRCGKSYKTAQGLRQHVNHQHPPTSLTPSPSPKSNQVTALTTVPRTTGIPSSSSSPLVTSTPVGITVQSANVIVEPIPAAAAVPSSNSNHVIVEPVTTMTTPGLMSVAPLTPTTQPTAGFTIVTLPSQIEGTSVSANGQVTGAVIMTTSRIGEGGISALLP